MLSSTEPLNRKASCGTTASCSRSELDGHLPQVVAVDEHGARGRVVEARQQLDDRRLAGAGGADQRDGLAGRRSSRSTSCSTGLLGVVAEGHVAQLHLAAHVGQGDGVGGVEHVGLGVEHGVDLLHRGHRRLEGVVELAELLQRVEEAVQVADEGHQHADLEGVAADERAAVPEHDDDGRRRQELDEAGSRGRSARRCAC